MRSKSTLSTAFANSLKRISYWCYRDTDGSSVHKTVNRVTFGRIRRAKTVLKILLLVIACGFILKDDHYLGFLANISYKLAGNEHSRTVHDIRQHKWFIAALLKNNAKILPNWFAQVEKFIDLVGPSSVFVSIVENGDSIDGTGDLLRRFSRRLVELNVPHNFSLDHAVETLPRPRIDYLADLRTAAILPLRQLVSRGSWITSNTRILFLNDIVFTVNDLIELIGTNRMDYDIACAMDFAVIFYDLSVSRDLDDRWPLGYYPFFKDAVAIEQVHARKPVRVFACWNGVVVMRPEPFVQPVNISVPSSVTRFRNLSPRGDSECFLVCKDFWLRGYNMILINPKVKVAYHFSFYFLHQLLPWNQFLVTNLWYSITNQKMPGNHLSKLLTRDSQILNARNWSNFD